MWPAVLRTVYAAYNVRCVQCSTLDAYSLYTTLEPHKSHLMTFPLLFSLCMLRWLYNVPLCVMKNVHNFFDKYTTMISTLQCHLWLLFTLVSFNALVRFALFLSPFHFSLFAVVFRVLYFAFNRLYTQVKRQILCICFREASTSASARSLVPFTRLPPATHQPARTVRSSFLVHIKWKTYVHIDTQHSITSSRARYQLLYYVLFVYMLFSLHRIFYSFWWQNFFFF